MNLKLKKYREILNEYSNLVPPILISIVIGFAGIAITDTIMVGRLGSEYLASASFANSLYGIFFIFSIGIGVAITPMISAAYSKNNYSEANKVLKHALLLNLAIGFILYLIMLILIYNLNYLKQSPKIINLAKSYMHIIALSIIPNTIKDILKRYIEGMGLPKISMFSSIITFFINIFLNYLLINGKFGFPELKLLGAGIATFIARIVDTSIISFFIFVNLKKKGYLKGFNKIKFTPSKFINLMKICFPSAFQLTLETSFFAILNIMAGWIGIKYQAAHAIAINISRTTFAIPLSISIASSIIIGRYKGKNNLQMLNITGIIAYSMVLIFYLISSIILINYFNNILACYKAEFIVENIIKLFLPLFIIFQIADGFNVVGVNLLRGLQDTLIPVIITSSIQWIFGISLAYLLAFKMDLQMKGIWIAANFTFIISSFLLSLRFKYQVRK